ncbi:unnamed protein product [Cuscuta europaea]|uniref:THO complex subunit 6 n=1 Tax=Cuscuta europaea TaxID=41803 RepID=A0A9P1DZB2_CUSEU|nr:unnamed protein product [Cuscuta europaea]
MVMDCRNWNEDSYRESVLQERETQCRTVFRTAFGPNSSCKSTPDHLFAATSDGSIASYSISSLLCLNRENFESGRLLAPLAEPNWRVQGHDGPAYDITFYSNNEDSILLSCGDDGRIRGWKWNEMSESNKSTQGVNSKPVIDLINPQHKGPWGSLSPIPENNAIAVNPQNGSVFAAAGDSCAYCWDLERSVIKMVFKGHSDYLHCITARNSHDQVLTGSEDGTVRIWDCKSGKCVQIIEQEKDKANKETFPYISCIALDASESWLAFGSGPSLSLWNLPACHCISKIGTHFATQDVIFDDHQILTVGSEPILSRFSMSGEIISQIQCAPESTFSISLHPSGVTAVAGYGALVDVISHFGSHLCTFRCKG